MYNEHIFCEEYHELKDIIVNIINEDDNKTDIEKLSNQIQDIYDSGKMPSTQYHSLRSY